MLVIGATNLNPIFFYFVVLTTLPRDTPKYRSGCTIHGEKRRVPKLSRWRWPRHLPYLIFTRAPKHFSPDASLVRACVAVPSRRVARPLCPVEQAWVGNAAWWKVS